MDRKNLAIRIKQSVDESARKLQELKSQLFQYDHSEIEEELQSDIDELEKLSRDIQNRYDRLNEYEKISEQEMSVIEKNFHDILKSLGGAYSKADSLINK